MTSPRVIVLEDDTDLRSTVVRGLSEEGFEAVGVASGLELMEVADLETYDVFVIDIGLPDADGRDVCQALRSRGITASVLILTARTVLPDRLTAFACGADDYVTKPFAFAELVARLRALIRRNHASSVITVNGLVVDPASHEAECGGKTISLSPTEFRLLARLASTPGQIVPRRVLMGVAWPHGAIVHDNTLDAYITRLRRKCADLEGAPGISTIRGVGYRLG